jgi:hypothetical protein
MRRGIHVCHMRRRMHVSYEEEDTCEEQEDRCLVVCETMSLSRNAISFVYISLYVYNVCKREGEREREREGGR